MVVVTAVDPLYQVLFLLALEFGFLQRRENHSRAVSAGDAPGFVPLLEFEKKY